MATDAISYLAFLAHVIAGAILATLGAVVSVTLPCLLFWRIFTIFEADLVSYPAANSTSEQVEATRQRVWDAIFGLSVSFTSTAYVGGAFYSYIWSDSVVEGALKGTVLVVGASVGVAACVSMLQLVLRWLRHS